MKSVDLSVEELMFFHKHMDALPIYEALKRGILETCGDVRIQVKKNQISFYNRHMFAAASFLPVRKADRRPKPYLTVTFGLGYPASSDRVDRIVQPYPNRWTHHVLVGQLEEVDSQLLGWLREAAAFSEAK